MWEKDGPCTVYGICNVCIGIFKAFGYKCTGFNLSIVICSLYIQRDARFGDW